VHFLPKNYFLTSFPFKYLASISHWPKGRPVPFLPFLISLPSFSHAAYSSTLKMEAADNSDSSVPFY
jgi:hypothetical protein